MRKYKESLQQSQRIDIKIQLKDMLRESKKEYQIKDRVHFQQACEKLYKVMIHVLELKSGYNIKMHNEIYDGFFWKKAGFRQSTMIEITNSMSSLHNYFYEGSVYPSTPIEGTYNKLIKYIDSIVGRLWWENTKLNTDMVLNGHI